jgi:hypothetical protein
MEDERFAVSTVEAFEPGLECGGWKATWLRAGLTGAQALHAHGARRTVVLLGRSEAGSGRALVVVDEIRRAEPPGAGPALVMELPAEPEIGLGSIVFPADEIRAGAWILEPAGARIEKRPAAGSAAYRRGSGRAWRVVVLPGPEAPLLCQVIHARPTGGGPFGPPCSKLPAEGGAAFDFGGAVLIVASTGSRSVECLTGREAASIIAVGLPVSAGVRLLVAGEEATEAVTSTAGALAADTHIPAKTGLAVSLHADG